MTKRTARIITSFAVLFMLIGGASAKTFGAEKRDFNFNNDRNTFTERTFKARNFRFSRDEVRLNGFDLRARERWGVRFERVRGNAADFRALGWDDIRTSKGFGVRIRERQQDKYVRQFASFTFGRTDLSVRDRRELKTRRDIYRLKEFKDGFALRTEGDIDFGQGVDYRFSSFVG